MFKKIINYIKEEYAFIIFLFFFFIICNIRLDYFITIGGGISDVSSRIIVEDANKSKGSFNISYVSQLDANVLTFLASYIVPSWEREKTTYYKDDENENFDDIDFRADLDLKVANSNATYWAYTLAKKQVKELSRNSYIIANLKNNSKIKVGDEVLEIDGLVFDDFSKCREYVQSKNVDDIVNLKIKRNDKEKNVELKVYEEEGNKYIGIAIQTLVEYESDPNVTFSFNKNESGPSGGLITTLELYNQLTKKDLTKGKIIAGTGTIEADGSIDEIGGIEHKISGAARAKADIFLCPGGDNYKDAKKYIKDNKLKIKLIKVDNIQDAIKKLEELD